MQKLFTDIEDLLRRLHQGRGLIRAMFNNRKKLEFRRYDALQYLTDDGSLSREFLLDDLIDYGVITCSGDLLELEESYLRFFEEVLQVNEEVSSAMVEEHVKQLRQNIDYYKREQNNVEGRREYLRKIRRSLRAIAHVAERSVIDLKRNINDTYKQERNFDIKRDKLNAFLEQIDDIVRLVRSTEHLLDDEQPTLTHLMPDQNLQSLMYEVRAKLNEVAHNLIGLIRVIRAYLNQVDSQSRFVKKIRRIKSLRDKHTLEAFSNIREVVEAKNPLWMEPTQYHSTRVSLDFLRNDDAALPLLADARRDIARAAERPRQEEQTLNDAQLTAVPIIEDFIDIDMLADAFRASGRDLFTFVMQYQFVGITPTLEQRVECYTEIIQNRFDKLRFDDEWHSEGDISYPLVYYRNS
jgi:hypothetical protein